MLAISAPCKAQSKKDSAVKHEKQDTVSAFVFTQQEVETLKTILVNSKIYGQDGQPVSGKELFQLLNWIDSHRALIPKEKNK